MPQAVGHAQRRSDDWLDEVGPDGAFPAAGPHFAEAIFRTEMQRREAAFAQKGVVPERSGPDQPLAKFGNLRGAKDRITDSRCKPPPLPEDS